MRRSLSGAARTREPNRQRVATAAVEQRSVLASVGAEDNEGLDHVRHPSHRQQRSGVNQPMARLSRAIFTHWLESGV